MVFYEILLYVVFELILFCFILFIIVIYVQCLFHHFILFLLNRKPELLLFTSNSCSLKERVSSVFGSSLSLTLDEIDWKFTLTENSKNENEESSDDGDEHDAFLDVMCEKKNAANGFDEKIDDMSETQDENMFSSAIKKEEKEEEKNASGADNKTKYQSQKELLQSLSYRDDTTNETKNLFTKDKKTFTVTIKGLLTSPNAVKHEGKKGGLSGTNNKVYMYINNRYVESPVLAKAFINAYKYAYVSITLICFRKIILLFVSIGTLDDIYVVVIVIVVVIL